MAEKSPRAVIEALLARMEGLKAASPNGREFVRWRHEAVSAVKEFFPDDAWMVFKDIPFYDYKKIMGFYAKSFSPEAYQNGLARSREFLEKKLADLK